MKQDKFKDPEAYSIISLTNEKRLKKLKQAKQLIREVEFSFESENYIRKSIYAFLVNSLDPLINFIDKQLNK